jgi:hypothetical protein
MSPIKKFGYANTELFTLSGTQYTGYYNIFNNTPYIGKYSQKIKLDNANNIQNIVTRSDLFFNRIPTQNFSLTFSLSDFVFQPNEFINSNSIDNKLRKAFRNFLDTYVACFMPFSNLPYNMTYIGKVSATNYGSTFVWVTSSLNTPVLPLSNLSPFFTRESKIAYTSSTYNTNNTLIVANSGSIVVYKIIPGSTFNNVFSSFYIETNVASYGSLTFNNITSISLYDKNLYICDSGNKSVYAYDITGVVDGDRALGGKFNLKDSVNNTQGNFINPTLVGSSENSVFVYDSGTYTVYFFDTNFNLKDSYKNEKLFSTSTPVSLSYYKIYNQLYLLTEDLNLVIFDSEANANIIQLSTSELESNEVGRKIIFSNSNSDILYLLTNKNLYKKFVSNIVESIGDYTFNSAVTGTNAMTFGNTLYDISILDNYQSFDNIILYGYDQFINYNEQTVYYSIIK